MINDDPRLLFDLFEGTERQGPGSVETTRRALRSQRAEHWRAYYAGFDQPLRDAIERHGELHFCASPQLEREMFETFGDEYGYLCLVLQVATTAGYADWHQCR